MPTASPDQPSRRVLDDLTALTKELADLPTPSQGRVRDRLRRDIEQQVTLLKKTAERLDPVLRPVSLFDPGDPETSARVIALATVAQPRHPLAAIRSFYGAGVYLLYYRGPFEPYAGLTGKEQPVYVGKADPSNRHATDALGQGQALFKRLNEHSRSIRSASTTVNITDFDCRFLIVQSGFQQAAEARLINFFKPIWNNECDVCYGIGKHGDSSETRSNKRSPWDTLHPGRSWAESSGEDQKPRDQIVEDIAAHLERHPPKSSVNEIVKAFTNDMLQIRTFEFRDALGGPQEVDRLCGDTPIPDQADADNKLF